MTEDRQDHHRTDLVELTTGIVSAYVMHNFVRANDVAALVEDVHTTLSSMAKTESGGDTENPIPAVPVRKSINPDFIVSLENGRRYKTLKMHLTALGMTPVGYRAKWGLPPDYPMVAPNYAMTRSEIARSMGLGRTKAVPARSAKTVSGTKSPSRKRPVVRSRKPG